VPELLARVRRHGRGEHAVLCGPSDGAEMVRLRPGPAVQVEDVVWTDGMARRINASGC
jgi:hypothetical protein